MELDDTLSACVGQVLGEQCPVRGRRSWLAQRNLGLAAVDKPAAFEWPGPFLGRLGGSQPRWVVLFGVPPGILWDPLGDGPSGAVEEALVLAPLDAALDPGAPPYGAPAATDGSVQAIVIAPGAEAPGRLLDRAQALAGRGLEGDRYAVGQGTFSGGIDDGRALTLVEGEVLDELSLGPADARRNLVTRGIRLNALMGHAFTVGGVECAGRRLCEPCAHLERLTRPGALRALVHRGGLRADILTSGEIAVGDRVTIGAPLA